MCKYFIFIFAAFCVIVTNLESGVFIRDSDVKAALLDLASEDSGKRASAEAVLLQSGHVETIRRLAERLLINDGAANVIDVEGMVDYRALPILFETLPKGSLDFPPRNSHIDVVPSRLRIANIIFWTISHKQSTFPEATKLWARKTRRGIFSAYGRRSEGDVEVIGTMQEWWFQNKGAILSDRPQDAIWLPGAAISLAPQKPETSESTDMLRSPERLRDSSLKKSAHSENVIWRGWITLAIVTFIVAAFVFIAATRSKRKK